MSRVIDAWLQHPTPQMMRHPIFESLRRWTGMGEDVPDAFPIEVTMSAMDNGGVDVGLFVGHIFKLVGPDRAIGFGFVKFFG